MPQCDTRVWLQSSLSLSLSLFNVLNSVIDNEISRLTCPEPYFVSEALYCLPEELENTREVTLRVITIGKFVTDSNEVSFNHIIKHFNIVYLPSFIKLVAMQRRWGMKKHLIAIKIIIT